MLPTVGNGRRRQCGYSRRRKEVLLRSRDRSKFASIVVVGVAVDVGVGVVVVVATWKLQLVQNETMVPFWPPTKAQNN